MVTGVQQTRAALIGRLLRVKAAARTESEKQGNSLAGAMRVLAPRDDGDLMRSIRVEGAEVIETGKGARGFSGVMVKAGDATTVVENASGVKFQNARLQEHGTKTRPANPFFYPAWKANRRRIRAAITRAANKAWRQG